MTVTTTEDNPTAATPGDPAPAGQAADHGVATTDGTALVEEDLLVEDVSIDGMCGVY
jgi:mycofactocin precursor